jgi:hypothetical protein
MLPVNQIGVPMDETHRRQQTVIPRIAANVADAANIAAIDRLISTTRFPYIVAWGKWLGFTPGQ